jgi:hypothetical protein
MSYFERVYKILILILPFHVIFSVFFQYKLWIPGFSLYKEVLIFALFALLAFDYYKNSKKIILEKLDYAILAYIWYLVLITIFNYSWIGAFIYWWRYDFEFLLVFLITRHWAYLLNNKLSYYLRIFLISWWAAILIWMIIRFITKEWVLVYFWFSPHVSNWVLNEGPPIYHWIEWASVRRFQWIFDWPNQAAFFLIVYAWLLFHYLKNKKDAWFYLMSCLVVIWWLVFMTYCRSALIWIIASLGLIFILNIRLIIKKYRNQSIWVVVAMVILWALFNIRYWWHMEEILLRAWSTKWHSERMIIWVKEFISHPLGQWLASSWPWYRFTHDTKNIDEKYFIPESWYVQQLVEGWVVGFILFMAIMLIMSYEIYFISTALFFSFIAVLTMNVLLHTFEASYVSMVLFMFLGLFLKNKKINS